MKAGFCYDTACTPSCLLDSPTMVSRRETILIPLFITAVLCYTISMLHTSKGLLPVTSGTGAILTRAYIDLSGT